MRKVSHNQVSRRMLALSRLCHSNQGSVGTAEETFWPGARGWCSAALRGSGAAAQKLAVVPSALPAG